MNGMKWIIISKGINAFLSFNSCPFFFNKEGSLSCHRSCNTGPRFSLSHLKDRPILSRCTASEGYRGPILSRIPMGTLSWVNVSISYISWARSVCKEPSYMQYISYLFRVVNVNYTGRSFKCDHPNPGPVS